VKKFVYSVFGALKETKLNENILNNSKFEKRRIEAEIVRNVHSIEKGLSISNPRIGFGIKKIKEMLSLVDSYMKFTDDRLVLYFVIDALDEYLQFQKSKEFYNEDIEYINQTKKQLEEKIGEHKGIYGGTTVFEKGKHSVDIQSSQELFDTRHSIREFSGEPVPEELLIKAIEMAQRAPSACNRQAVRIYSISSADYVKAVGNLDGIGGFAEDVDKFLIITGVRSAYRRGEKNQYIVSASMLAAYMTLSLHALGIGCCTVQHSLVLNKSFINLRDKYQIPEDEQPVVTLAIGMMKEIVNVPVSKRYPVEKIYRELK
jgi:nitroreductase